MILKEITGFPRLTSFNLFFGGKISDWTEYHLSIGVALPAALVSDRCAFVGEDVTPQEIPAFFRDFFSAFIP